jgi:shikimate kinase
MDKHRAVFLVGFMGAGKTSVGKELARRLGWRFVDLDDRVTAQEGKSVAEIFRDSGESAFRKAEGSALRQLLGELAHEKPTVAALGGGAFVQDENAWLLAEAGEPMVFLDAEFDVLRERCRPMGPERPLFVDESRFRALYETRRPHYLRAGFRVDTTHKPVEQVAAEIIDKLGLNSGSPEVM